MKIKYHLEGMNKKRDSNYKKEVLMKPVPLMDKITIQKITGVKIYEIKPDGLQRRDG